VTVYNTRLLRRRLRECRLDLGFTQAQLGKMTGFHPSAVAHFESGRRSPSVWNLCRLAQALDVSTDFLLGRSRYRTMVVQGAEVAE